MKKKRQVTIPSSANIKCPNCGKSSRISLSQDTFIGNLDCKKCHNRIETPPAYCCIVCAFSKKKCPQSLIMEAKMKNLEIKYQTSKKPEQKQQEVERKPVFLIDKSIIDNSKNQPNI